jgi:hypothetical protein
VEAEAVGEEGIDFGAVVVVEVVVVAAVFFEKIAVAEVVEVEVAAEGIDSGTVVVVVAVVARVAGKTWFNC